MKIVVLLHTYNGAEYLEEQLQSLLKQDISSKAEVKILVRDDGSTDKTWDILDKYKNDGKIGGSHQLGTGSILYLYPFFHVQTSFQSFSAQQARNLPESVVKYIIIAKNEQGSRQNPGTADRS